MSNTPNKKTHKLRNGLIAGSIAAASVVGSMTPAAAHHGEFTWSIRHWTCTAMPYLCR